MISWWSMMSVFAMVSSPGDPIEIQMKGTVSSFDIEVSNQAHTLVELPMRCSHVLSSDEKKISAALDPAGKRFLYIRAAGAKEQETASVTVQCPGDVAMHFIGHVVSRTDRTAIRVKPGQLNQQIVEAMLDKQRQELAEQVQTESTSSIMTRMLESFQANNDDEQRSSRLVFVRAYKQLRLGNQGYVLFSVRNKAVEPFVVKQVSLLQQGTDLGDTQWMMRSPIVPQGATEVGVVSGTADDIHLSRVSIVVTGGGRDIEVPNIDF